MFEDLPIYTLSLPSTTVLNRNNIKINTTPKGLNSSESKIALLPSKLFFCFLCGVWEWCFIYANFRRIIYGCVLHITIICIYAWYVCISPSYVFMLGMYAYHHHMYLCLVCMHITIICIYAGHVCISPSYVFMLGMYAYNIAPSYVYLCWVCVHINMCFFVSLSGQHIAMCMCLRI